MPADFIRSGFEPATSRYGSHMGTCYYYPAMGWAAWRQGRVEITAEQYPGLDGPSLASKAVAILRNRQLSA